jgi:glycosyltransferase involved in cell wall biosynthesis
MRKFTREIRDEAANVARLVDASELSVGFVGNTANNLYLRAVPLRRRSINIEMVVHPADVFVMSDPAWEEYDGELYENPADIGELRRRGVSLPTVPAVWRGEIPTQTPPYEDVAQFMTPSEYAMFSSYAALHETFERASTRDVLLTAQAPYLALFARRPYLATQIGGDIWYDCSRDDVHGHLQRRAFRAASAFLVSNPWSYAHARRYRMSHFINMPLMLDETVYTPGQSKFRKIWQEQTGGDFFVLSTARLDDFYKGSMVGLHGFANFARMHPGARLILLGWGKDKEAFISELKKTDIGNRILVLPLAGKRRLIRYLQAADCLLDQFVLGYYGATGLEAMACGLPIIMRLEHEQYDAMCETGAPPVMNAATPDEVTRHLLYLHGHPVRRRELSDCHRAWFEANHGDARWATEYKNFLVATAIGHRFDFRRSPLRSPLTASEISYHAEQLAGAPEFPNYS